MGREILAVTGSQSTALLSSARRSVLDRATAPQSSALRNPDTRWGSHGDLRPLMGAEVVTPEEPHPNHSDDIKTGCEHERGRRVGWVPDPASACLLYTSDAADDLTRVDLGGRRIIKKKKK